MGEEFESGTYSHEWVTKGAIEIKYEQSHKAFFGLKASFYAGIKIEASETLLNLDFSLISAKLVIDVSSHWKFEFSLEDYEKKLSSAEVTQVCSALTNNNIQTAVTNIQTHVNRLTSVSNHVESTVSKTKNSQNYVRYTVNKNELDNNVQTMQQSLNLFSNSILNTEQNLQQIITSLTQVITQFDGKCLNAGYTVDIQNILGNLQQLNVGAGNVNVSTAIY